MSGPRERERKVFGLNAVRALAACRPEDVLRLYVTPERVKECGALLKACAARRRPYRIVPEDEMARVSGSDHHEGVCAVARRREVLSLAEFRARIPDSPDPVLVALLHDVRNPHNLGAILRTAAHFGASVVLTGRSGGAEVSGAACRLAEGGAEHVLLAREADPLAVVTALRSREVAVYATAVGKAKPVHEVALSPRAAFLFGAEEEGLPRALLAAADAAVTIPGSGAVESLNVSCAVAVVLADARRRHPLASRP
ncbi:MAG: rRNA methyltransferase [Planctomycetes bacterium]|jgi:TrmH RNA methyltransferase|nr:rRNA methyltransferase [Planctomycetota bacterium]